MKQMLKLLGVILLGAFLVFNLQVTQTRGKIQKVTLNSFEEQALAGGQKTCRCRRAQCVVGGFLQVKCAIIDWDEHCSDYDSDCFGNQE